MDTKITTPETSGLIGFLRTIPKMVKNVWPGAWIACIIATIAVYISDPGLHFLTLDEWLTAHILITIGLLMLTVAIYNTLDRMSAAITTVALWLMAAGIWLPNILQVIWWRFNAWGYLSAWIANLGLSWLVVWVLPMFGVLPDLPDYLQFWALMVLTILVYLPVTYLTEPEDMDHLVKFYVMSRPIGFWGPVRKEAERQGLLEKDHRVR